MKLQSCFCSLSTSPYFLQCSCYQQGKTLVYVPPISCFISYVSLCVKLFYNFLKVAEVLNQTVYSRKLAYHELICVFNNILIVTDCFSVLTKPRPFFISMLTLRSFHACCSHIVCSHFALCLAGHEWLIGSMTPAACLLPRVFT